MKLPKGKVFQLVAPGRSPPCHLRPHSQSNPIISIARQQQKIYICFIKILPSSPGGGGCLYRVASCLLDVFCAAWMRAGPAAVTQMWGQWWGRDNWRTRTVCWTIRAR